MREQVESGMAPDVLATLGEAPSASDEFRLTPSAKNGDSMFHYPVWWTAFVCFLREGMTATKAYRSARPGLPITDANYQVKSHQLLRNPVFRDWLKRLEDGSIAEVDEWRRKTIARSEKWRERIEAKAATIGEDLAPKDIKSLVDSENVVDLMARRSFGIDDERSKVQVTVNVASIIQGVHEMRGADPLPADIVEKFSDSAKNGK